MKLANLFILVFISVVFLFGIDSYGQEKKISENDLPSNILTAFHKAHPKAEIKGASIETEKGKKYYEIESVEDSVKRDITYTEDGKLAVLEEEISFDETPVLVKDSFKENYSNADVLKSEKVTKGKKIDYEFLIEENDNRSEVVFDTKGKVVKVEKKIPNKVMEGLKGKFPHPVIENWTREKEGGMVLYDIEFKQEGQKFEADIKEDGSIDNWEKAIQSKDLPTAVRNAVGKKYPNSSIKEVMQTMVIKNGKDQLEGYEITLRTDSKKHVEVTIAPDGNMLEDSGVKK